MQTQTKAARKTVPSKKPRKGLAGKSKITPPAPKAETSSIEAAPRTTKQELVLTLLSRKEGASVDDIMKATGWQVHSVRGFFAGTVKKKRGFTLTSSKAKGEKRLYRIEVRGAR